MAEPVSSATGGYWAGKIAYAIGGFLGGASTALFWQPARLREHGKMVAVGAIATQLELRMPSLAILWRKDSQSKVVERSTSK